MAKMKFLKPKKKIIKELPGVVTRSATRGLSFLGTQALSSAAANIPGVDKIPAKAHGPAFYLLGLAIEAVSDEDSIVGSAIAGVGQGMNTFGVVKSSSDFLPDTIKSKIGLSGVGAVDTSTPGNPGFWDNLLKQAGSDTKALSGAEEDADADDSSIKGIGATPERMAAAMNL